MKKIYRMMSKKELLKEVLMECKTAAERKGLLTGVPTWFYDLDYMTRGLQKGDLVLISGHALSGKKALALSIARNVALKEKKTVAYFSLGVSGIQVMNRLVSMDSEVKLLNILSGRIDKYGWDCLKTSAERIADSMMYVFDNPCSTLDRIRNICVKVKKNKGLDLIVVDNFQLINVGNKLVYGSNEKRRSLVAKELKKLAVDMDCPVMVVSKLPSPAELEDNKRPEITDLAASDGLIQYSDVIMFLYRDWSLMHKVPEEDNLVDIIIAKNRIGREGVVRLRPELEYSRFVNLV